MNKNHLRCFGQVFPRKLDKLSFISYNVIKSAFRSKNCFDFVSDVAEYVQLDYPNRIREFILF